MQISCPTESLFDLLSTDNKLEQLKLDDEDDMLVTAVELVIAKVLHCDILGDFSTVENDGP